MYWRKTLILFILISLVFTAAGLQEGETEEFSFTGEPQEFEVPEDGVYELRVWGAQGGDTPSYSGGLGGYAKGELTWQQGEKYYVYVGENPPLTSSQSSAWPDGGLEKRGRDEDGLGGGSSSVRIEGGDNPLGSPENPVRIIVAGGGSGGYGFTNSADGAAGGGLVGEDGTGSAEGGTQTSGGSSGGGDSTAGSFGEGGEADDGGGSSGGGGWYGGGGGGSSSWGTGGGGSGYLDDSLEESKMDSGVNSGHGKVEIELVETDEFCNFRGSNNECIMNETSQLPAQQFNVSSVFESRSNAVFEAFNDEPAVLQLENTTTISGLWTGNIQIESDRPRLEAGAEFRPEGERIFIGE